MPLIPADALTRVLAGQDPDQPQAPVPPKPILAPLQKFVANPLGRRNYSPRGVVRRKQ